MRLALATSLLFALTGCGPTEKDTGDTGMDTGDTETGETGDTGTPAATFAVTVTATGVDVTITNGVGDYDFGLAQGGTTDNWTGEDCYNGYNLQDGTNLQFCHTAANGTTSFTSIRADVEAGTIGLQDGLATNTNTLFDSGLPGVISWYFADSSGACFVGGDDSSGNYDALGCQSI